MLHFLSSVACGHREEGGLFRLVTMRQTRSSKQETASYVKSKEINLVSRYLPNNRVSERTP